MKRTLPKRPSLEHLKAQSKDLLASARRGDPEAIGRFSILPSPPANPALHDAQSVIAREYGFASWNALREGLAAPRESCIAPRHFEVEKLDPVLRAALIRSFMPLVSIDVPRLTPFLSLGELASVGAMHWFELPPASMVALKTAQAIGGVIAVFAKRDSTVEGARASDLYDVGSAARIVRTTRSEAGTRVLLHCVAWLRLEAIEASGLARVAPFAVEHDEAPRGDELRQCWAAKLELLPVDFEGIRPAFAKMTLLQIADSAMSSVRCSVAEKAAYAAESTLSGRIERVLRLLVAGPG